tara:strand:- start:594 stop:1169 length:576 start_codon:yes stop_codon:yes gene_type:complete
MFAFKNKYFLIIESIKDINLSNIKKHNKFVIIYRSKEIKDSLRDLIKFRKKCNLKKIKFYIANDYKLTVLLKSDGIYLSSYNKSFKALNLQKSNFDIIGSAHDFNEISLKIKQGCNYILLSKLFLVNYDKKSPFLNVVKYSKYLQDVYKKLVPLGGITSKNINKLKVLNCEGFALLSEIKKKPANIINRLF